jgi:hypothetical protein
MKIKKLQSSFMLLCLAVFSTACNGQIAIAPTITETPSPSPTFTPTTTPTLPPTETPIPQPASLTGTILLSADETMPFVSSVELRQGDGFALMGKSDTDSNGVYKIENIDPAKYDLWILITTKTKMVSGCTDVAPPDNTWKIGMTFGEDKALSMENAHLSKGILLAQNLQASGMKAQGFFAVLEGFKVESGMENKMDVTLLCK